MIQLDGSYEEGGGALVRVALALSTLTGKEFKVINIRSGRPEPGLKAQHLSAIKILKDICKAKTNEIDLGTPELFYSPQEIKSGKYEIDIGTAGSISLLLQAVILPCLFAPGKVTLKVKGGTCGKWQASVDYLKEVLLPQVQRFAEKMELKIIKRGYYPQGGGEVILEINPRLKKSDFLEFNELYERLRTNTASIKLIEQGNLEQIRGVINLSSDLEEKEVGERIKNSINNHLRRYDVPKNIRIEYVKTLSTGGEVVLSAFFSDKGKMDPDNPVILGSDALLEKNKSSEEVGKEAAEKLIEIIDSAAAVDPHLADQLIPFMGLLPGSRIKTSRITDHVKTNIYVVEKFLPVKFMIEGNIVTVEEIDNGFQKFTTTTFINKL